MAILKSRYFLRGAVPLFVGLVAGLLLSSLGLPDTSEARTHRTRRSAQEPARLHRFTPVATPSREIGESCTANGRSICLSGICLHVRPEHDRGWICSRQCARSEECPAGWRCASALPGPGNAFCVPPKGWQAQPARERQWQRGPR